MIKHPLPLLSNNSSDSSKSSKSQEKSYPSSSKSTFTDLLECEEEIEVLSIPISSFAIDQIQIIPSDSVSSTIWHLSDTSYVSDLLNKELEYMPNPYYLQTMQANISPQMRSILYDWMMEVCSELTLKRETFHLAVNYADRYLSRFAGIQKEDYQLLGLTCMYIAAKIEEVLSPNLTDWASSADNGYDISTIIMMEKHVFKTIDFKVFPGTCCNWMSWLMTQWDNFLDFHFGCVQGNNLKHFSQIPERKKSKEEYEERMIFFKQANQSAYKRYRETMQILDVSLLHPDTMKFLPKHLSSGLLYLMISKYFYETNYELLHYNGEEKKEINKKIKDFEETFDNLEIIHLENTAAVQELFSVFIKEAAGIKNIEEIYNSVSFFHPFLEFDAVINLPIACKMQNKAKLESHYEDFLAYQTHNVKNLDFITNNL